MIAAMAAAVVPGQGMAPGPCGEWHWHQHSEAYYLEIFRGEASCLQDGRCPQPASEAPSQDTAHRAQPASQLLSAVVLSTAGSMAFFPKCRVIVRTVMQMLWCLVIMLYCCSARGVW